MKMQLNSPFYRSLLCGLILIASAAVVVRSAEADPTKLYWCAEGSSFPTVAGTLISVDPNGSNPATVRTATGSNFIRGCTYTSSTSTIYFAEDADIIRANPDNSSPTTMQSVGTTLAGIAIDSLTSRLYWADVDNDRIQYASSVTALDSAQILASGANFDSPIDIEIDSSNTKLYSANFGSNGTNGSISRVNLNGSSSEIIVSSLNFPWGLALDPPNNRLWYTLNGSSEIWSAALNGTNRVNLTSTIGAVSSPSDIDYDRQSNKIYWVQFNSNPSNGRLRRANPDGTEAEDIVTSGISSARFLTFIPDSTTQVPTLVSPAASTTYVTDLPITYTLAEAAAGGSAQLVFLQGATQIASMTMIDATSVNTTIQPFTSSVSSNLSVVASSGFPIAEGTYSVRLSYQDAFGNTAASTTNSNVVLALPTATPTSTSTATPTITLTATPTTTAIATPEPQLTATPAPTIATTAVPTETPLATPTPACTSDLSLPVVRVQRSTIKVTFSGIKNVSYKVIAKPVGLPKRKSISQSVTAVRKGKVSLSFESLKKGLWSFYYESKVKKKIVQSCPVLKQF